MPILLVLTVLAGTLLSRQCSRMAQARALAASRHLGCMEMVTRAAREAAESGRRPESLAELVGTAEKPGAIETLYLREYAGLAEFAATGSDSRPPNPARHTEGGQEPRSLSIQVQGVELLWDGYRYRLWPSPDNAKDFVVFAWPEAPGVGRLTSACLSTEPGRYYCTYAVRYAGADAGPKPADLGEPFAGRISLMKELNPRTSPEEFMERAGKSGGRQWVAENMKRTPGPDQTQKR